jgi:tetratricopeptide (TPR) repeat protein
MKPLLPLLLVSLLAGCGLNVQAVRTDRDAAAQEKARPEAAAKPAEPARQAAQSAPQEKPEPGDEAEETEAGLPALDLTPKLLYQFLLAEIAGQRGQLGSAAELFRDLARETRDPRIARRATEMALHGRRMDTALQAARIWLEIEPASAQARQTLVSLLAAQGRYDELKTELASLLAADPAQQPAQLMRLNRLLARGGDRQAVRELVDRITLPYLGLPEAHYARAQAAFEARDVAAALQAIQRALEMKPDWESAALLHVQMIENRAEAMAELDRFLAAHPRAREARQIYARALVSDKRYEEARHQFRLLLEQDAGRHERSGDTIFAIAVLSLQLDDNATAERYLRQLLDIGHAEGDKARYHLGQIAEEGKRWDEALQWFGQVGRGEHYLNARLHAANVMAKQGRLDQARRHLAETEVATPRERVQLLIGEAQILREAGRPVDAHAVLVAGLARQPDQPELLYEIALLADKLGRPDELEARLRRLIEVRPDHAHAYNALGYALAQRNERLGEARELIERALELAPNDPFILDSKGWVLFRLGDAPAALEVLNFALGIRFDPEISAHLGEVLWSLGRKEEARATWEKARREFPANEVLAETIKRLQR